MIKRWQGSNVHLDIQIVFQEHLEVSNFIPIPQMEEFISDTTNLVHHQRLIANTIQVAKEIKNIEGLLLRGSLGAGNGDLFSDIDMIFFYDEETTTYSVIKEEILQKLHEIGSPVGYFYNTINQRDLIIYFHPFVKYELTIRSLQSMRNRRNFTKAKILYDPKGLVTKLVKESDHIQFQLMSHFDEIKNFAECFSSMCYIISGYVVRGEHLTAIDDLDWLRNWSLKISGWLLGMIDEGPRRAELRFPHQVLEFYRNSRVKDSNEIWNALQIMFDWFETWLLPQLEQRGIKHTGKDIIFIKQTLLALQKQNAIST